MTDKEIKDLEEYFQKPLWERRAADFQERLKEAGVACAFTFEKKWPYKAETHVGYDKDNSIGWHKNVLAVQGLIYHFQNRGWIRKDSYVYINQNIHTFEFTEDESD